MNSELIIGETIICTCQRFVNGFLTCNEFMIINACNPYFDPCDHQQNVGGKIGENGMNDTTQVVTNSTLVDFAPL